MSESFNIGDRVRYRAEMVERGYLHPRKLELTGKILRLPQGQEKCYLVKWNDVADSEATIHGSWLESVPPSGRTFEAIVKELGWHYNAALNSATKQFDECVGYLFNDGHAEWMFYPCATYSALALTATELAAIAAACSELAANYAAEHGKEDA